MTEEKDREALAAFEAAQASLRTGIARARALVSEARQVMGDEEDAEPQPAPEPQLAPESPAEPPNPAA